MWQDEVGSSSKICKWNFCYRTQNQAMLHSQFTAAALQSHGYKLDAEPDYAHSNPFDLNAPWIQ